MENLNNKLYKKAMEALEKFLAIEFSESKLKKYYPLTNDKFRTFEDRHKLFLIKYSILKEHNSATKPILGEITEESATNEKEYFRDNPHVKAAKELLQERYNTFNNRIKKDPKAFSNFEDPDDCCFANFLNWWYDKVDKKGNRKCCYCGIDENTCKSAFENGILSSEKFTGTLHIERKDPKEGYNKDNCEFACALCNNAKSDMITEKDFRDYFKEPMQKYWEHIKEELDKIEK